MNQAFDMETHGRLSTLESNQSYIKTKVTEHDHLLDKLDTQIGKLVNEVKQIRNALYFMGVMIAANVPALGEMVAMIKVLLNG